MSIYAFLWLVGPLAICLTPKDGPKAQSPKPEKAETRAVRAIIADGVVGPGYTNRFGRRMHVTEKAAWSIGGSGAARDIDGLRVGVGLVVGPTDGPARSQADSWTWTQRGRMSTGVFSRRYVGEQVWCNWPRAELVTNRFTVVVLDGRTAIMVFVELPILERRDGVPFRRKLDPKDIRMAEDIAIGCVKRARAAGFGADPATPARTLGPKPETLPGSRPPDEPAARKKN